MLHLGLFTLAALPVMLAQVRWRPDVVLTVEPPLSCAPQSLLVARLSGAQAWLHIQDFEVDAAIDLGIISAGPFPGLIASIEKAMMRAFDRVSTISHAMMDRLRSKGLPEEKAVFFPNWVDGERVFPDRKAGESLREQLGVAREQIVALYSGNLGEKQGLDILLDAAEILRDRSDVTFLICGDGAAKERLSNRAAGYSNVRFLPLQPVSTFNALLNLADIHLLPQRADAADLVMPSKLTGILACGGAVVATAVADTEVGRTVLEAGGLLCPPGDAGGLANSILALASDRSRRDEMGVSAGRFASEHLGKAAILARFESELLKQT